MNTFTVICSIMCNLSRAVEGFILFLYIDSYLVSLDATDHVSQVWHSVGIDRKLVCYKPLFSRIGWNSVALDYCLLL